MKYIFLIPVLLAALLVGCDCERSVSKDKNRFVIEEISTPANCPRYFIVTDTQTGIQYLDSSNGLIELKKPSAEKF